jgi:hypothetical protein
MNKRIQTILVAVFAAVLASGSALAQRGGGGGGHGGAAMGGSGGHYGGWHGGGYSGWHGGGYNGWHGGYYGGRGYYPYGWYGAGLATGLYLGGPLWWGAWPYGYGYGYGYPYYSAAYGYPGYTAADTTVYVEQSPAPQSAPVNNFWYYCTEPAGYFPYVQNCNRAWMQVVPQPVPGPRAPLPMQ